MKIRILFWKHPAAFVEVFETFRNQIWDYVATINQHNARQTGEASPVPSTRVQPFITSHTRRKVGHHQRMRIDWNRALVGKNLVDWNGFYKPFKDFILAEVRDNLTQLPQTPTVVTQDGYRAVHSFLKDILGWGGEIDPNHGTINPVAGENGTDPVHLTLPPDDQIILLFRKTVLERKAQSIVPPTFTPRTVTWPEFHTLATQILAILEQNRRHHLYILVLPCYFRAEIKWRIRTARTFLFFDWNHWLWNPDNFKTQPKRWRFAYLPATVLPGRKIVIRVLPVEAQTPPGEVEV